MKKISLLILILTTLLTRACDTNPNNSEKKNDRVLSNNIKDTTILQTFDTTVFLNGPEKSGHVEYNLTNSSAKKVLYDYFETKNYFTSDNLPSQTELTDKDYSRLCVSLDTVFVTELNDANNKVAIITYWLTPPYASGHCWQPHKAIISDAGTGYKITNTDFIPEKFVIDSVVNKDNQITIFCYDYECGNNTILRNLKIRLKFRESRIKE